MYNYCSVLFRLHAVTVTRAAEQQYENVNVELKALGVDKPASTLVDIIDGYIGEGYGLNTEEELSKLT